MNVGIKSLVRWLIGLPVRLLLVLCLTSVLLVILLMLVAGLHVHSRFVADGIMRLLLLALLAGYTWAVYFGLPIFLKHARWQRIFISSVPALGLLFLTYLAAAAVMNAAFSSKSDQRVESVTLPSGEILENHTYCDDGGWPSGSRINQLFLKNPATGSSERIDAHGDLDYDYGPSLLQKYPHPQEFVHGDEKVLTIGTYICQRRIWKTGPEWEIRFFGGVSKDAAKYLRSFVKTNSMFFSSTGAGPENYMQYRIENLDLENNVLTYKRIPWNVKRDLPELRDFPDYLVYSSCDYHGNPAYNFPWEFDLARTRAKNGPRWKKPMPFRMALDYSVITFRGKPNPPPEEKHAIAMARPGAKEIATATLELSDQELRAAECRFTVCGTNHCVEKFKAMYGYADAQTNHFYIIWQPHVAGAFPVPSLVLGEWVIVGEMDWGSNSGCDEFIRLRRIEP